MEAKNVIAGSVQNLTIQLHKGEILGVGGLSDCGMHDVGKGSVWTFEAGDRRSPERSERTCKKSASWAVRHGIGYVSKNRDQESLMLISSIADNICLPSLKDLTPFGPISDRKQKQLAEKWSERMEVKADSVKVFCNTLSGGNKQKSSSGEMAGEKVQIS